MSEDEKASSSTSNYNPKLNGEIHLAITTEPSEYASSLCDHLFTLYRDAQHRTFVLQFLPSFVIAYYDVLYHHPESDDAITIKGVLDDGYADKINEFRIPNLTLPSIYHIPNPDHYAPTPLTQHAISKHEKKCEVVRLQTFLPFDSVNATTREQILWFLLIQYGMNVSAMDTSSRQAYFEMTKKLLGQGFSFDENISTKKDRPILPRTGRRIRISSRIMSEILGTLSYLKANSTGKEAAECMHLLKQRAEYEMYADVILMTESMSYLHEFETQRHTKQDTIGIEIELPPTIDMVKQKRTATTTRSMKSRQRSHKSSHHHHHHQTETAIIENDLPNDTIEHLAFVPAPSDASPTTLTPPTSHRHKSILDVLDENSPTTEFIRSTSTNASMCTDHENEEMNSLLSDTTKTNISSSIGPATSSPSPSSARHYKPKSLTSTQTYFNTIQQQQRASSPNMQQVQTIIHNYNSDDDSIQSRTSSMRHGEKKETFTTVRFMGTDENKTKAAETYL
ncbi:unnamed protein product [Adineta steineri]|uniref:Uncharacterized protein n=1 Tax=Adineta steineri TaxID=433720 RepID=A0A814QL30_9BILA|nr:unnamed protein product [Adineta steineri]CAF3828997.1 unnamed protein product [Adineta steineri]